ncbi:MAG: ATP synthase F1 subunit epsilon [Candidatus Puniceispirillales bacterium]|jgi:F-type H+-transporting ATPase subunit epsilon|nr:ATP synthase F1 subunit epsilon [Alphaproteobacteria bacterium]MDA0916138.1 ATP synthase F1 subunit epsilon [Pseudomonadota bacterium]
MSDTTNLEIVTPSMVLVSEPVEMVVVPGADGQIGALPRHSKVMSTLDRGIVNIYNDSKISSRVMIDGGIVEINENSVVILAERAEKLDKVNKQILEEKLLDLKAQQNDTDPNISSLAAKNSSFLSAVLENIE